MFPHFYTCQIGKNVGEADCISRAKFQIIRAINDRVIALHHGFRRFVNFRQILLLFDGVIKSDDILNPQ